VDWAVVHRFVRFVMPVPRIEMVKQVEAGRC
jgi:hypothetical protein